MFLKLEQKRFWAKRQKRYLHWGKIKIPAEIEKKSFGNLRQKIVVLFNPNFIKYKIF